MRKVLILTSIKTGSGHHSSSKAIEKKLKDKGFITKQLDVFPLMGKTGEIMENSYIPLTTKAPFIYYLFQRLSEHFSWIVHSLMYFRVKNNLLKEIDEYKPDLIISVHCMFTKAISHLIRKHNLKIPFYIGVIDLVDPPRVWEDKNADITFVPTEKVKKDYLDKGFDEKKTLVSGFPVRDDIIRRTQKPQRNRLHILMINPTTDLQKNVHFVKEVSRLENTSVYFVCGLDKKLYQKLNQLQQDGSLSDNVKVYEFVDNINELLDNCDLLLCKAGPNMIIESLYSGTPIIITGHINGQENNNYKYVVDNGFGIRCENPKKIYEELKSFIDKDMIKTCQKNISEYNIVNGAEYIADYANRNI